MTQRRGLMALALAFACSVGLAAQSKDDKKKEEAHQRDIETIKKLVDGVTAGQTATNDFAVTWVRQDFLKATGQKEYVPFTVSIDPTSATAPTVEFFWRVVPKTSAAPTDAASADGKKKDAKKDKDKGKDDYPWQDATLVPLAGKAAPLYIARSFTVPAGSYDVYVAVRESTPEKAPKNAPPPKTSIIKQSVTVPDFWNNEFDSTVIVYQRMDPLPAPLTPQQQIERPYAMGPIEVLPAYDLKLTKKSELAFMMLVYNPKADSANKPNVTVEYNFCQVVPGNQPKPDEPCKSGEKFFNHTAPQNLNAQTLQPDFDLSAGHQVQTGQAVPLASFPEGQYRLEIKVTDKLGTKTLVRDINFSVGPS